VPHGVYVLLAPRDELVIGSVDVEGLEGEPMPVHRARARSDGGGDVVGDCPAAGR